MSLITFDTYSLPQPETLFSADYFRRLTFEQSTGVNYPITAPRCSIKSYVFTSEEPTDARANYVLPDEVIPHTDDLFDIIREAQKLYTSDGRRAVYISMVVDGQYTDGTYHFSKVWHCPLASASTITDNNCSYN